MHVVLTGGTGFLGQALTHLLTQKGHRVTILTRRLPDINRTDEFVNYVEWLSEDNQPENELEVVDAIVNLAGESINSGRWTKGKKEAILNSRLTATKEVIRIIGHLNPKPKVLINASGVSYYGMSDFKTFNETSQSRANDFLAKVVSLWENEGATAQEFGIRTVFARFGIILGQKGALPLMVLPYKFGIGGTIGNGMQWISWVHIQDVVEMLYFAIIKPEIDGPLNVTSPNPIRMSSFGRSISDVLHRPHWLRVPEVFLKVALGEMGQVVLKGQRVLPQKALYHNYSFHFTDVKSALSDILG
ncbi:TIGR01777 family oxidoreductase [Neobacillus novalis]|uniref:TIGR01777 family oxidoreductase n=1 Tax=Neobacillus novalis TaxID=220687 RepID=A0AA95MJ47_9BACI|nr:TIGR01777 family oxidoreductase [Neobacillus novalis]WHY84616.1 TIGR01777 family oxidoreductase [Neobacillus novalis]